MIFKIMSTFLVRSVISCKVSSSACGGVGDAVGSAPILGSRLVVQIQAGMRQA